MVRTHPAITKPTERQRGASDMHDNVIHASAPRIGTVQDVLGRLGIVGEDIEGEWVGQAVDDIDGLFDRFHVDDREDRPEDLVLHNEIVQLHIVHDGGCDVLRLLVHLPPQDDLLRVDQLGEPRVVSRVYDPTVALRFLRVVTVKFVQSLLELFHELGGCVFGA